MDDRPPGDVGVDGAFSLADQVANALPRESGDLRPGYGVLALRQSGQNLISLEVLRRNDGTWSRRVRAPNFVWNEGVNERLHDAVVHPQGDVTLALEALAVDREAYLLVRLAPDGTERIRQALPVGLTLPAGDIPAQSPNPPWRLVSRREEMLSGPLTEGWVRMGANGADVDVTFLSLADTSDALVLGVAEVRWNGDSFDEVFTRIVDGAHTAMPPAWQYDELRFGDALVRPLITRDETRGTLVVGRTWTTSRCRAVRDVFGLPNPIECSTRATGPNESREHAFAATSFSEQGVRLATVSYVPDDPFYFTTFGLAARDGELALAGTTSVQTADGSVAFYDGDRVPFDAVVTVLDAQSGVVRWTQKIDRGRADVFTAIRWSAAGIVAAGITDFDRWNGGMSISRGGDPLLAAFDVNDGANVVRVFERAGFDRHSYFLDIELLASGAVVAAGVADAPLTHSGDGARYQEMTFGGLAIQLGE